MTHSGHSDRNPTGFWQYPLLARSCPSETSVVWSLSRWKWTLRGHRQIVENDPLRTFRSEPHRILAISPIGTKLPIRDLRSLVAIEVEVDSARTSSDRRK